MLFIVFGVFVAIGLWLAALYNGLVKVNVRVDEAWSDITVQLKRRYDLIPNLVSTVKGYAKHEKDVFEAVTKARNVAEGAASEGDVAKTAEAENMFTGTLKSLFAVAEAYPELKADQNFLQLQSELVDTENKVQASRRFYNGAVRDLNTKVQVFPTNLFAGMFGFKSRDFFEVENQAEVEVTPDVQF